MYAVELMSVMVMPITIIYIAYFVLRYWKKYMKINLRNEVLKFTQEELKEKRKEIDEILVKTEETKMDNLPWEKMDCNIEKIRKIFSLYNEIAVGINEGLYDEVYAKMVMGYDMIIFYKSNYKVIVSSLDTWENSSRFLPLELLLKKWDSEGSSLYRLKKHKRNL